MIALARTICTHEDRFLEILPQLQQQAYFAFCDDWPRWERCSCWASSTAGITRVRSTRRLREECPRSRHQASQQLSAGGLVTRRGLL
jgi:hypothetical protein